MQEKFEYVPAGIPFRRNCTCYFAPRGDHHNGPGSPPGSRPPGWFSSCDGAWFGNGGCGSGSTLIGGRMVGSDAGTSGASGTLADVIGAGGSCGRGSTITVGAGV